MVDATRKRVKQPDKADLDIRSVWVRRPNPRGLFAREFNGVHVDCMVQREGPDTWAVHSGEGTALGKDGEWILEPRPSSRDDQFFEEYRWDTMDEALAFAEAHL